MSLARPRESVGKGGIGDATIWQLRNELLEGIGDLTAKESGWIEIRDPPMVDRIVSTYGNSLNRKILNSCLNSPRTMMEIVNVTGIPQTTGYRKITSLISHNFLFANQLVPLNERRHVMSYLSAFKEMEFHMTENQEWVRAKVRKEFCQKQAEQKAATDQGRVFP